MSKESKSTVDLVTAAPTRNRRILYLAVVSLYWMGLYLYVPTLPVYVRMTADNLTLVGVVLAMYGLWQALIRLPLGIVADWLGRYKPLIIVGLGLVGVGAWIMGTASSATALIVGRAVTGLAAGTWVLLVVVFSNLFPPREAARTTALLTFVNSGSRMLATAVTGTLNEWGGYSLAFYLATGLAALSVLVILPAKEERRAAKRPSLQATTQLITRRDVLLPALLNALLQYANWSAIFSFIPLLARQLGASDVLLSALTSMNIGIITAGNLLATTLLKRTGSRPLVYFGFITFAAGMGIAALASSLVWVFVGQFCMGAGVGVGYPVLMGMSIEYVEDAQRATAMGLHQAVYAIGMFVGPWASGLLADAIGIQPMFGVTVPIFSLVGWWGLRKLGKRPS